MKRIILASAAVLAFTAVGHADELSEIQAQSKLLREQNQALTKRLADLEKRQKKLEQQTAAPAPAAGGRTRSADAMAVDLPYKAAVNAPAKNDNLCWQGVCIYGGIDMGVSYIQHGAPLNNLSLGPLSYPVSKNATNSYFGVGPNQFSPTTLGLRGKREIFDDLYGIFNLQSVFNSASGQLADGIGSIVQNNGLPIAQTNAFGDSAKAGQVFNNLAYAGVSSPTYGTFTYGRQSSLTSDAVVNYDPLAGSSAWSLITYFGSAGGGGDTANRNFDNSFEYRLNVGPVRLAVETQLKSGGNNSTGNAVQGNIGFDYLGLSMDFVASNVSDAVASNTLTAAQVTAMNASGINVGKGGVSAVVSDNTAFLLGARYTIGAWKLFAGYEYIDYANPKNPLTPGAFIQGGYTIFAPNNTNFATDKILQISWAGVRYAVTPDLDITGAYYHFDQNSFRNAANPTGTCNTPVAISCSGTEDAVSFVVDWRFAKQFDLYAGIMWSQVSNGLANGFLTLPAGGNKASNYDPGIGLRYQF